MGEETQIHAFVRKWTQHTGLKFELISLIPLPTPISAIMCWRFSLSNTITHVKSWNWQSPSSVDSYVQIFYINIYSISKTGHSYPINIPNLNICIVPVWLKLSIFVSSVWSVWAVQSLHGTLFCRYDRWSWNVKWTSGIALSVFCVVFWSLAVGFVFPALHDLNNMAPVTAIVL